MDAYINIFEELPRSDDIKYRFTGKDDSFLIYAFLKNSRCFSTNQFNGK